MPRTEFPTRHTIKELGSAVETDKKNLPLNILLQKPNYPAGLCGQHPYFWLINLIVTDRILSKIYTRLFKLINRNLPDIRTNLLCVYPV